MNSVQHVANVPSRQRRQGAQTKEQIIEAACDLIGDFGYESVTTATLIDRAQISKGGLYHHFGTLDDVIIAAYEKTSTNLFSTLGDSRPKTVDDYLEQVEQMLFQRLLVDKKKLRIMHELLPRAMYDPVFIQRRQTMVESGVNRMIESFASSFKQKVKKSELTEMLLAVSVFISGLAIQYQLSSDLTETRKIWARFRTVMQNTY